MYKILILVLCFFLFGCVTGDKVRQLVPGMSQDDVVLTMGKPDGFQKKGDFTILKYTNRLLSGWSWDRTDYYFIFDKNNKLIEYGPGEIREKNVNGIHSVFIYQM